MPLEQGCPQSTLILYGVDEKCTFFFLLKCLYKQLEVF